MKTTDVIKMHWSWN